MFLGRWHSLQLLLDFTADSRLHFLLVKLLTVVYKKDKLRITSCFLILYRRLIFVFSLLRFCKGQLMLIYLHLRLKQKCNVRSFSSHDRVLGAARLWFVRHVQSRLHPGGWNELQGISDRLGRRRLGTTRQVIAYCCFQSPKIVQKGS